MEKVSLKPNKTQVQRHVSIYNNQHEFGFSQSKIIYILLQEDASLKLINKTLNEAQTNLLLESLALVVNPFERVACVLRRRSWMWADQGLQTGFIRYNRSDWLSGHISSCNRSSFLMLSSLEEFCLFIEHMNKRIHRLTQLTTAYCKHVLVFLLKCYKSYSSLSWAIVRSWSKNKSCRNGVAKPCMYGKRKLIKCPESKGNKHLNTPLIVYWRDCGLLALVLNWQPSEYNVQYTV